MKIKIDIDYTHRNMSDFTISTEQLLNHKDYIVNVLTFNYEDIIGNQTIFVSNNRQAKYGDIIFDSSFDFPSSEDQKKYQQKSRKIKKFSELNDHEDNMLGSILSYPQWHLYKSIETAEERIIDDIYYAWKRLKKDKKKFLDDIFGEDWTVDDRHFDSVRDMNKFIKDNMPGQP